MITFENENEALIGTREQSSIIGRPIRIFTNYEHEIKKTIIRIGYGTSYSQAASIKRDELYSRMKNEGWISRPCYFTRPCDLIFDNIDEDGATVFTTIGRIRECIQNNLCSIIINFEDELYTIHKDIPQSLLSKKDHGLGSGWNYLYKKYNLSVPENILKDIALTILFAGNGTDPTSSEEACEIHYYDMMHAAKLISFNAIATSAFRRMYSYKRSFLTTMKKKKSKYESIRI